MAVFPDDDFAIYNQADHRKVVMLDVSASPVTGVLILQTPKRDGMIALDNSVEYSYPIRATSTAPTVLWANAPTGVYMIQAILTKYSGAGSISVTPTWDGGAKDENLITNFS